MQVIFGTGPVHANGRRDAYVEPNEPVDPSKDKRVNAAVYSVGVNPVDNSIWGTVLGFPGYVLRLNPGPNPPETALAEVFEPPLGVARCSGATPRLLGLDPKTVQYRCGHSSIKVTLDTYGSASCVPSRMRPARASRVWSRKR